MQKITVNIKAICTTVSYVQNKPNTKSKWEAGGGFRLVRVGARGFGKQSEMAQLLSDQSTKNYYINTAMDLSIIKCKRVPVIAIASTGANQTIRRQGWDGMMGGEGVSSWQCET